jgi:hypothetical protein
MSGTWWSKLFPRKNSGFEAFGNFAGVEAGDAAAAAQP